MSNSGHATDTPSTSMPQGIVTTAVDTTKNNETSSATCENTAGKNNNCVEETNESGGSVSPSSSSSFVDEPINDEEDDIKSYSSSGRDSGVGNSQRNNREEDKSTRKKIEVSTSGGSKLSPEESNNQVDLDSSFIWGASLLYYTGIPTPKLKEHHFNNSLNSPSSQSSSASTFSLFKGRSNSSGINGKLFRSTLSLQSSNDSGMDENHQGRRSPWRFRGGSGKKFNTLPIKGSSPVVAADMESSFRAGGSSLTMATPDSGFSSGTGGDTKEDSPMRRRHASCHAVTPTSSTGMMGGLRGKIKSNTSSLRLLKNVTSRPSLSSFLEKSSSQSLPRSPRNTRICEEMAAQQEQQTASIQMSSASPPTSSGSSSGLKSAKKALRNSFKAARSLLPSSSSTKIGPAATETRTKTSKDKLSLSPSPLAETEKSNICVQNSSAPNTPQVIKKSRLERARKRFTSTLSLHSSSSNNGGYPDRSKSASTLVISDSEVGQRGGIPTGVVSYHHRPHGQNASSFSTEESSDVLAVVEAMQQLNLSTGDEEVSGKNKKGKGQSGSKSPFRFIGRSRANKEKKSDTLPQGFLHDAQPVSQQEGSLKVEKCFQNSSPEANIELHAKNKLSTSAVAGAVEGTEKPSKKRMSLVKSFMGKTILRGSGSKKIDDDGNKEINKEEPIIFYSSTGGASADSESKTKRRSEQKQDDSLEIVTFDNEPKVRTPKASRRHRLNSGSGTSGSTASSSVTCTPPPLPTQPPPPLTTPTLEQDRELHELEVSETSIDFSPVKSQSHYDAISNRTREGSNERNNYFDGAAIKVNSDPNGSSSTTISPKKTEKKKSQRLITSLVSLSPSSAFSSGKNMEDMTSGSKKKKKNSKKSSKKASQEATTTTLLQTSELDQLSGTQMANSGESIVNNNNSPLGAGRRRKSSEDFKELRKNGIVTSETTGAGGAVPVLSEENTQKIEKEEEKLASAVDDTTGKTDEVDADNNEVDETDDPETACTASFRQLMPFNYDLEPVEEGKKERLYKVLVVGELGAGKTSIIKRYVHQFFSQHYRATIGVDFALKVLRWDPDTVVRLQLWDIAGQERFGSMTRVYYKEAVGAFVVFDVTRSATLEAVPKWKADLDAKVALPDGRPIPTVLLANKSDQPKEGIAANREKMNDFCQQQGFSAWFETSAKDNINIDESANFLVSKILEMDKWSQEPLAADPDKVELTANGKHKGSSSSNCAC